MTRKALSRLEESKLQRALQELKATKALCDQLVFEREDNEKVLEETLNSNKKLKSEMAVLHTQYTEAIEERDKLQIIICGFDQCGIEYEQALKRTSLLEKELCDAHLQITLLEEAAQCSATLKTFSLYDELISSDRDIGQISAAGCNTPTIMIDLTNDDSVGVDSACTKNTLSRRKSKKYVKINKYINKTKNKLKNNKYIVDKLKNKIEKKDLLEELELSTVQLENTKLHYETDIQQLQCELASVEDSLRSITGRYERSQEAMREYSLAMDELLKLSQNNKDRYDSLVANHMCDCQCASSPEPVSTVPSTSSSTSQLYVKSNNNSANTVMFSDEIGKNMGHILNSGMNHSFINNCLPDSSMHEIMDLISKYTFNQNSNLVIWLGNRGNVNKAQLIKYVESLYSLEVNKIVMFTFPYSNSLPQAENNLRYKLNITLHTICNNNLIHLIDSNNIVSKPFYLTKGRYYLSNYLKRQVAVSLSYYFNITAKNLAKHTASIEQCPDMQSMAMEVIPSHLN